MEETESVLLSLCSNEIFRRSINKFSASAGFFSSDGTLLLANTQFIHGLKELNEDESILKRYMAECKITAGKSPFTLHHKIFFFPIIINGSFHGYTGLIGSADSLQNLNMLKHDINNILTILLNIIDNAGHAANFETGLSLTNEILSSADAGSKELPPPVCINELLPLVCAPYNISGEKKQFELTLAASLYCRIKKGDFIRIITNLLTNAAEAVKDNGKIIVSAIKDKHKKHIAIKILNTGDIIPEANISRVFEEGFSTKNRGSGFGLAIVKELAEKYSGTITAENTLEGTLFTLCLPAAMLLPRLALIEDELIINELLTGLLSSYYEINSYTTGDDFVSHFTEGSADLIIMDKKLPGKNGLKCIREVREKDKKVKIILATGSEVDETENIDDLNIDKILIKPYNFDQLLSLLSSMLA